MRTLRGFSASRPTLPGRPGYPYGYRKWLRQSHGVHVNDRMKNHYEAVCQTIKNEIERSAFWTQILQGLRTLDDEYLVERHTTLVHSFTPPVVTKSFDSFLNKTFRKNILRNANYPDPPTGGWLLPPAWLSQVNDVVRTTLTVHFLDGVEYLLQYIREIADGVGGSVQEEFEARVEGYYAVHLYFQTPIEIVQRNFSKETRTFSFEIQITTQVKELIKEILHPFYERERLTGASRKDWRWDYNSDEFIANHLGHILHYVEGMIVQVRDRQREAKL